MEGSEQPNTAPDPPTEVPKVERKTRKRGPVIPNEQILVDLFSIQEYLPGNSEFITSRAGCNDQTARKLLLRLRNTIRATIEKCQLATEGFFEEQDPEHTLNAKTTNQNIPRNDTINKDTPMVQTINADGDLDNPDNKTNKTATTGTDNAQQQLAPPLFKMKKGPAVQMLSKSNIDRNIQIQKLEDAKLCPFLETKKGGIKSNASIAYVLDLLHSTLNLSFRTKIINAILKTDDEETRSSLIAHSSFLPALTKALSIARTDSQNSIILSVIDIFKSYRLIESLTPELLSHLVTIHNTSMSIPRVHQAVNALLVEWNELMKKKYGIDTVDTAHRNNNNHKRRATGKNNLPIAASTAQPMVMPGTTPIHTGNIPQMITVQEQQQSLAAVRLIIARQRMNAVNAAYLNAMNTLPLQQQQEQPPATASAVATASSNPSFIGTQPGPQSGPLLSLDKRP